jgi:hypothetical protein
MARLVAGPSARHRAARADAPQPVSVAHPGGLDAGADAAAVAGGQHQLPTQPGLRPDFFVGGQHRRERARRTCQPARTAAAGFDRRRGVGWAPHPRPGVAGGTRAPPALGGVAAVAAARRGSGRHRRRRGRPHGDRAAAGAAHARTARAAAAAGRIPVPAGRRPLLERVAPRRQRHRLPRAGTQRPRMAHGCAAHASARAVRDAGRAPNHDGRRDTTGRAPVPHWRRRHSRAVEEGRTHRW